MTRTTSYTNDEQIIKSTSDSVRSNLHSWHDPSIDRYFTRFDEEPVLDNDGNHVTNDSNQLLYNVTITTELRNIPENSISNQVQSFVNVLNNTLPSQWPSITVEQTHIQ